MLPAELGKLGKLSKLILSTNRLQKLPEERMPPLAVFIDVC